MLRPYLKKIIHKKKEEYKNVNKIAIEMKNVIEKVVIINFLKIIKIITIEEIAMNKKLI